MFARGDHMRAEVGDNRIQCAAGELDAQEVSRVRKNRQRLGRPAADIPRLAVALLEEAELDEIAGKSSQTRRREPQCAGEVYSGLRAVYEHLEQYRTLSLIQRRPTVLANRFLDAHGASLAGGGSPTDFSEAPVVRLTALTQEPR